LNIDFDMDDELDNDLEEQMNENNNHDVAYLNRKNCPSDFDGADVSNCDSNLPKT
jgi:hypothetical protein